MELILRRANHAGSWYHRDPIRLGKEMKRWLDQAEVDRIKNIRAIIGPHAGYAYSGKTASYAYKLIDSKDYDRVVVMGPSHRKWIPGIAIGKASAIETPFGNLNVDVDAIAQLQKEAKFYTVKPSEDEAEHSLEMHYPWVAKVFEDRLSEVKVIPLIVGDLDDEAFQSYSQVLKPFLEDKRTLFIISSDFCHWGHRFDYVYTIKNAKSIYKSIEELDHMGMDAISSLDPQVFRSYLKKYRNTICGRFPISVLLHTVQKVKDTPFRIDWVHYSQSNQVTDPDDSSVSYASGILHIDEE